MVGKFRFVGFVSLALAIAGVCASQVRVAPVALIVLDTAKAPATRTSPLIPPGWQLKTNAGFPNITFSDQGDQAAFHFRSDKSSFGLERSVDIDPSQMPYLSWRWKVTQLPRGGDFRHSSTDDQAAQVLVAFDDRHIITYLWDTTAPQGTMESASSLPLVHIFAVVCRSGAADMNQWLRESRNVAADYQRAFGKAPTHVKGVRLQINSQHTGTSAESYFGEVVFRSAQL